MHIFLSIEFKRNDGLQPTKYPAHSAEAPTPPRRHTAGVRDAGSPGPGTLGVERIRTLRPPPAPSIPFHPSLKQHAVVSPVFTPVFS